MATRLNRMTGWLKRIVATMCLAATCLAPMATGQNRNPAVERFELFNACRPMELLIEGLSRDATEIELTKEQLQAAAESRLRASRLYTEDPERADYAYLYVNVNVSERVFYVSLEYIKTVTDAFDITSGAVTWDTGTVGSHGGDAGYIVSVISQSLDRFLAAYLRVNEPACG